jgi:spore coat polysaccharide biosynthesis protein SpsF
VSRAVIILQARMGSARLHGKVLAPIGARSMLGHCIARLRIGGAAPVLLATTTKTEDDCLADVAARYGVPVFRGPEDDVLTRFVLAARSVDAEVVVRATADNPAIDIGGASRLLAHLRTSQADHVIEDGLPYGAAVEAVNVEALSRAAVQATDPVDREHVTPLIRRDTARFTPLTVPAPLFVRRPDVRVTVDTESDLAYMREIAARLDNWAHEPELHEILDVADRLPGHTRCA